jgi:hypothetical protein
MRVVSFTHFPLYSRGNSTRYPFDRRLRGPQSRSGHCGVEKNRLPPSVIKPQLCNHPVRGLVSIPAELSWLLWALLDAPNNLNEHFTSIKYSFGYCDCHSGYYGYYWLLLLLYICYHGYWISGQALMSVPTHKFVRPIFVAYFPYFEKIE